jgi:hypothetical protein
MTPADFQAARSRMTLLYGSTPAELAAAIVVAAERIQPLATAIRPDEPGAAGRAECFAEHCDAMRRQALMLRQRIQLLKAQETSDAA